ncbi:MAG: hypothetical protein D3922_13805, partial [Candidatus Electrothrix sp. AR1]|nr:hypothetical protein [Candidatus Electrothrix sp. AR1]
MKPGQLSRADLLSAMAEENQQITDRIAKELKLFYGPPKKKSPQLIKFVPGEMDSSSPGLSYSPFNLFRNLSSKGLQKSNTHLSQYIDKRIIYSIAGLNLSPTSQLSPRYLQLVRYTQLNLDTEKQQLEEQKEDSSSSPVIWKNRPNEIPEYPIPTPLKDLRTRLFSCLLFDCQGVHSIDLPAIIDKISRAEFPSRLSKVHSQNLEALQIIDDRQVHLTPFWLDHTWLTLHLYKTFGLGQINRAVISNGDTEPQQISRDFTLHPFRLPPAGTPVLFLSDLGRLSPQGSGELRSFNRRQQQYRQLVRRLVRNNNPVTLLTPCSPVDYPALLRRQIRCLSWEPQARPLPAR